jgi:heptosyltransferase-2
VSAFAALADRFVEAGDQVCLIGSADERPLIDGIARRTRHPVRALAGETPLDVLVALLPRLAVLACNDAGARHVAVACGVPSVVFMGPTALEKTSENLERVEVLTHDVPCRPCYQRECPVGHECMEGIGVDRAFAAASRIRGEPRPVTMASPFARMEHA